MPQDNFMTSVSQKAAEQMLEVSHLLKDMVPLPKPDKKLLSSFEPEELNVLRQQYGDAVIDDWMRKLEGK